jgi:hypothetical protein
MSKVQSPLANLDRSLRGLTDTEFRRVGIARVALGRPDGTRVQRSLPDIGHWTVDLGLWTLDFGFGLFLGTLELLKSPAQLPTANHTQNTESLRRELPKNNMDILSSSLQLPVV